MCLWCICSFLPWGDWRIKFVTENAKPAEESLNCCQDRTTSTSLTRPLVYRSLRVARYYSVARVFFVLSNQWFIMQPRVYEHKYGHSLWICGAADFYLKEPSHPCNFQPMGLSCQAACIFYFIRNVTIYMSSYYNIHLCISWHISSNVVIMPKRKISCHHWEEREEFLSVSPFCTFYTENVGVYV